MLKNKRRRTGVVLTVLMIVFVIGLISGTAALFYVPEEVIEEARAALDMSVGDSFAHLFRENFMMEAIWLLATWILGSMSITSPFAGAVMAVRGFSIGFSVAFVLSGGGDWVNFVVCYILPQCVASLPVMTIFSMQCIIAAMERKHRENAGIAYFGYGILFLAFAAGAALIETYLMRFLTA